MLHSNYNLLTLRGLESSDTYLDKLPKDLVWYLLGYTGPKDGFIVMKKAYFNNGPLEFVKATTVQSEVELKKQFTTPMYYGPQYIIESVKFIFIDGKQYAAVPIKKKIDGFTPPSADNKHKKRKRYRCTGLTANNRRCKNKIPVKGEHCKIHNNSSKVVTP